MRPLSMTETGGVLVIKVEDNASINEGQATGLRQGLQSLLASRPHPRLVIDLSVIDFISSTGIALLIGILRRVEAAEGKLILAGVHSDIVELLALMKLAGLFVMTPTQEEAVERLAAPPSS